VIGHFGFHRTHQTQLIGQCAELRKQVADFQSALAVFLKIERRRKSCAGFALRLDIFAGQWFAGVFRQIRFRIKCVYVRWPAIQEKMNDTLGFARKMGRLGGKWIDAVRRVCVWDKQTGVTKQSGEAERAHPHPTLTQEIASGHK
jgi:hypothetical protein